MRVALAICCVFFALVTLLVYGRWFWPGHFLARVPMTNMAGVQRAVGRPVRVSTNSNGTVRWDYGRWWTGEGKVYFDTNGNYARTFTDF
ncbi:MAG TPA: hypothetical protein VFE51_29855 [Verrucomicrobiae bacterium]|nr:hypothetical protein [Verrucomicrobiae bacterium]